MKRLATLWAVCAVIGFAAAVGLALACSLAFDGQGAWRRAPHPPIAASVVTADRVH